jgi:hypothetical protein
MSMGCVFLSGELAEVVLTLWLERAKKKKQTRKTRHLRPRATRSRLVPDQARRHLRELKLIPRAHCPKAAATDPVAFSIQPNAPGGTSEGLMGHVIRELNFEGRAGLTFGASATEDLNIEYNLGGWKIKMLGKAYRKIVSRYHLANRGQFRVSCGDPPESETGFPVERSWSADQCYRDSQQKFGTEDEPLHIAYKPGSFGWSGLVALMKLMRVDDDE